MANRYWVGGTASWDGTAGTKWALTSGGAGGQAVPTAADDVFFDGASGAVTVTVAAAAVCNNITFTGFTGTFAGSSTLAVSGNMTLAAGMTRTYTGAITFNATTTGKTVTSAGKTLASNVTFAGSGGGWTLTDAINTTGFIDISQGTFDTGNQTVSCSDMRSFSGLTRVVTLGSSTVNLSAGNQALIFSVATGLTVNAGTSTLNLTSTSSTSITASGKTFYNIQKIGAASSGFIRFDGNITCNNLTLTPSGTGYAQMEVYSGFTVTVTGTLTVTGFNAASPFLIVPPIFQSSGGTINAAAVSLTRVYFRGITCTGAASWTGTSIGDMTGNTGLTPTAAVTRYWVATTGGNWSATTSWSTSTGGGSGASVPLPQDTAVFDSNSITSGGRTITLDVQAVGTIDLTNVTNSPTLNIASAAGFYCYITGNMILKSGITLNASTTPIITFYGSTAATLSANGATISIGSASIAPCKSTGVALTLGSDLTGIAASSYINIHGGTFDTANYAIGIGHFYVQDNQGIVLNMGSSILSLSATDVPIYISPTYPLLNAGTSEFRITDTSNANINIYGGNETFNVVWFQRGASTGSITINNSNTFGELKDTGSAAHSLLFVAGTTQTIGTWSVSGTAGNLITINSTTTGIHTLTKTSGVASADYLNIQHSVATAGRFYAGVNSVNNQAVATAGSGWVFGLPPIPHKYVTERPELASFRAALW